MYKYINNFKELFPSPLDKIKKQQKKRSKLQHTVKISPRYPVLNCRIFFGVPAS